MEDRAELDGSNDRQKIQIMFDQHSSNLLRAVSGNKSRRRSKRAARAISFRLTCARVGTGRIRHRCDNAVNGRRVLRPMPAPEQCSLDRPSDGTPDFVVVRIIAQRVDNGTMQFRRPV